MDHGSSQLGQPGPGCARLCHILKWDDFDGYGFNLHAEKGKSGQYIGKVDEGSPSEAAGLRQGDRIVEVNEINIAGESHKQVVERIKAFPGETRLLVVDQQADEYFRANNIPVSSTMPGLKVLRTPERSPASAHEAPEALPSGPNGLAQARDRTDAKEVGHFYLVLSSLAASPLPACGAPFIGQHMPECQIASGSWLSAFSASRRRARGLTSAGIPPPRPGLLLRLLFLLSFSSARGPT